MSLNWGQTFFPRKGIINPSSGFTTWVNLYRQVDFSLKASPSTRASHEHTSHALTLVIQVKQLYSEVRSTLHHVLSIAITQARDLGHVRHRNLKWYDDWAIPQFRVL